MNPDNQSGKTTLKLSLVIPAYNEEINIRPTLQALLSTLGKAWFPFEIIVVNDNCRDNTRAVVVEMMAGAPEIVLVDRKPPRGFGRAIREGLAHVTGDVVIPYMADLSDDPGDVIRYYRLIEAGKDCVFGSRFTRKSRISGYPPVKRAVNRVVNRLLQVMFLTGHNDLTNAFKAYRTNVIDAISPLQACHFNITIEMSLSALVRKYDIAAIPINWNGRTWGQSNLHLRQMGRRYLATLLKIWFERLLIMDDLTEDQNTAGEDGNRHRI